MDSEEFRAGSADSENGSSDSYVQVTPEDAQPTSVGEPSPEAEEFASPIAETTSIPSGPEDEDIYTFTHKEEPPFPEEPVQKLMPQSELPPLASDFLPETHEEDSPADKDVVDQPTASQGTLGVEDVTFIKSDSETSTELVVPEATGLLSFLNALHPAVLYVVYWKDPKLSAVVLGGLLVALLTLTLNTFIHTIVLFLLSFLVVSLTYIVAKIALDSFYNRPIRNPFSDYLNRKIALPEDKIVDWTVYFVNELNCVFNLLVRLMLFDNIKRSFKFGITLWILSFATNHFTLLRALFVGLMLLFAIPPFYSKNQIRIDRSVESAKLRISTTFKMVLSWIPLLKKEKLQ